MNIPEKISEILHTKGHSKENLDEETNRVILANRKAEMERNAQMLIM